MALVGSGARVVCSVDTHRRVRAARRRKVWQWGWSGGADSGGRVRTRLWLEVKADHGVSPEVMHLGEEQI